MNRAAHALAVAAHSLRISVQTSLQYRVDFLIQLVLAFFWVGWNVLPLYLIFRIRPQVAGWNYPQAMLVMSAFLIIKALLDGLVSPNLGTLVQHIRTGTFDFVLLKPVDAQVMVSTSKIVPTKAVDFLCGVSIALWSMAKVDPAPSVLQVSAGALMLLAGTLTIYAIWMLIISTAFWFVKIDNLSYLFTTIFDAGRWPISVFRGWVRTALTFVIPIALMTSYPAMAVLGQLEVQVAMRSVLAAAVLLVISRFTWRWAITHYASASS